MLFLDIQPSSSAPFVGSKEEEEIVRQYLRRKGFKENVIRRITNPPKKVHSYTKEEIGNAMVIQAQSPKAYEMMRRNSMTIIPLPHPLTLRRHMSHFLCAPGLQPELFGLLCERLASEDRVSRQAVLVFDEMHVKECYEYDRRLKTVIGGNKTGKINESDTQ